VPYRNLEPVSKQLTIVVGLTVVGFMAFGLALSFYRNILFEETLRTINLENKELAGDISDGQRKLEYYRSAQYKDKYAKENLGRLNPGEKILIITEQPEAPALAGSDDLTPTEVQEATYQEYLRQLPTILHWRLYLFERERIDQLKRGL
jgi:hypothetical protein